MTREQQIEKASIGRYPEWGEQQHALELAFQAGAQWADQHPHWISVEDELPTCNVFVLTCDGQGNTNLLMLADNGGWYDHSVAKHRNITHWMPLPSIEHLKEKEL